MKEAKAFVCLSMYRSRLMEHPFKGENLALEKTPFCKLLL